MNELLIISSLLVYNIHKQMGGNRGDCSSTRMLSMEEALNIVIKIAQRLKPITVPIHKSLNKILAEDIRAPDPLPPYRASIKVFFSFSHKTSKIIGYQLNIHIM